jgi:hypothetical protein
MRKISTAVVLVLVAAGALSLGSVAAGSSSGSKAVYAVMSVTGNAPKGAKVTSGTFLRTFPPGKFPYRAKVEVFEAQYFYYVSGKLKNGGSITCKITIGKFTKVGHAKGGRKGCTARLTSDNAGGWQ